MNITYEDVRQNPEVRTYITQADRSLLARGFTEHSFAHVTRCAETAAAILAQLGYGSQDTELARIAGFMHDIGNVVNRHDHALTGYRLPGQPHRRRPHPGRQDRRAPQPGTQ